jgi:transposase
MESPGQFSAEINNQRVRQSGLGAAHHGRISKVGRSHARAMLVEAA